MNDPSSINKLELIKVGDSIAVILPEEQLERLDLEPGDELTCSEIPHGIALSVNNNEFDRQMRIARKIMARDREMLRRLAKS